MKLTRFALIALLACEIAGAADTPVLAPSEIKDPKLRSLQEKHLADITAITSDITAHNYPSKFYLSRTLDLAAHDLSSADPRSIEFAKVNKQTVLRVSGNYAAVYMWTGPAKTRVNQTFLDVVVPILKAAVPHLVNDEPDTTAIVIEVSHHLRKVNVLTIERFENSAFTLPRTTAIKIAGSDDPDQQIAALSEAQVAIDGKVVPFGGKAEAPPAVITSKDGSQNRPSPRESPKETAALAGTAASAPVHSDTSAPALEHRQTELQPAIDRMMREAGPEAHFDASAKPGLTGFRGVSYLRIPVTTVLPAEDAGSQYRVAALAFDRHVSHLVRTVLPFFKGTAGFEGVDFHATVSVGAGANVAPYAVDFFFSMNDIRRYENYDVTGQQLINAGFVLINGERVSLDLQSAETIKP
jgi:hypothetical protein